jgi:alanine dehydrogenase
VETIHETTHEEPIYVVHDVVHYAVGNMPGAVPNTSTFALTNATLPYLVELAAGGLDAAADDPVLALGVNTHAGAVTHDVVAEALGKEHVPLAEALAV